LNRQCMPPKTETSSLRNLCYLRVLVRFAIGDSGC
jgi:hypothetical protein